jgi:hypothetical protein
MEIFFCIMIADDGNIMLSSLNVMTTYTEEEIASSEKVHDNNIELNMARVVFRWPPSSLPISI